jgi:hypothetical protein
VFTSAFVTEVVFTSACVYAWTSGENCTRLNQKPNPYTLTSCFLPHTQHLASFVGD